VRIAARLALAALAAGWSLLAPATGSAEGIGINASDSGKPIDIQADNGIEWQQGKRVYIARGNARATRGQTTVFGDTLIAYYRPVCGTDAAAAAAAKTDEAKAAKPASSAAAKAPACPPEKKDGATQPKTDQPKAEAKDKGGNSSDPMSGESTQIFRMEALGNVRIATETQTVYGDHAVYDLDQSMVVVTGKALKLLTPRDTVTARDSFEWYEDKQLGVARGDAIAMREGKRMRGDVLTAAVEKGDKGDKGEKGEKGDKAEKGDKGQSEAAHISRIDAQGNVLVSSLEQIARGDTGIYNVDTGIATLIGNVTITKGETELKGRYGVVDLNNNVSQLLSSPPPELAKGASRPQRVSGLLVPKPKPAKTPPGKSEPTKSETPKSETPKSETAEKTPSAKPETADRP
jgi:lipopolysaccharide export system protein LptA